MHDWDRMADPGGTLSNHRLFVVDVMCSDRDPDPAVFRAGGDPVPTERKIP